MFNFYAKKMGSEKIVSVVKYRVISKGMRTEGFAQQSRLHGAES